MDAPSDTYIRAVQRKNGKIIIRAMLELEKVTFESIVQKICEDFNIFMQKVLVENAVASFLRNGYHLGFIDVGEEETFNISSIRAVNPGETFNNGNTSKSCEPEKHAKNRNKRSRN